MSSMNDRTKHNANCCCTIAIFAFDFLGRKIPKSCFPFEQNSAKFFFVRFCGFWQNIVAHNSKLEIERTARDKRQQNIVAKLFKTYEFEYIFFWVFIFCSNLINRLSAKPKNWIVSLAWFSFQIFRFAFIEMQPIFNWMQPLRIFHTNFSKSIYFSSYFGRLWDAVLPAVVRFSFSFAPMQFLIEKTICLFDCCLMTESHSPFLWSFFALVHFREHEKMHEKIEFEANTNFCWLHFLGNNKIKSTKNLQSTQCEIIMKFSIAIFCSFCEWVGSNVKVCLFYVEATNMSTLYNVLSLNNQFTWKVLDLNKLQNNMEMKR